MPFHGFEARTNGPRFVEFLKKPHTGRPIIVIADGAGYHGRGVVQRYTKENRKLLVSLSAKKSCDCWLKKFWSGRIPSPFVTVRFLQLRRKTIKTNGFISSSQEGD